MEKNNIVASNIDEFVVYGKIPRKSISMPVFFGGTYSLDFMYVIRNKDRSIQCNFVVETKAINKKGDLSADEKRKILCGIEFFKQLKQEGYNVMFKEQLQNDNM